MTTEQLAGEFETFQRELKSFLLRMTASVQDAEDIVQETYLKAQAKIDTFRGESSLKTWVFSIASNLARDLLRSKKRWPENVRILRQKKGFRSRFAMYIPPLMQGLGPAEVEHNRHNNRMRTK